MSLRRARAIARKEFLHIVRDTRSLIAALAIPLLLLLLFGYALTLDVDRIPACVYDQDGTPESRRLVERFRGSRYFDIAGRADNYAKIEQGMESNRILLAVVIPRGFAGRIASGQRAEVQVLIDGSDSNTASITNGYVESVLQAYGAALRMEALNRRGAPELKSPVEPRVRVWYNEEILSKNYVVPGLIAVILMIIAALLTSLTIAREWEAGTMEQLLSTPVRPAELFLGKLSAYFGLGLADTLIAIVAGVFVFHVPMRGDFLFLLFTSCIFLVGGMSWGIFISAATRSQLMAFQASMITSFLPAFLLSGFVFAIENMPRVIQAVTYLVPARYFVTILKGIFLKGVGLRALWWEVLLLIVYSGVLFLLATWRMRQKMA